MEISVKKGCTENNDDGNGKKRRILYTTNTLSPYRIDFWNELSKYCEVTVLIERSGLENRDDRWTEGKKIKFNAIYLKSVFTIGEGAFCIGAWKYLKEYRNDIIVIGGYSTPTGMSCIEYLHFNRIPFILNCDGGLKKEKDLFRAVKTHFIEKASLWLSTGKKCDEYLLAYGAKKNRIAKYPFTSVRRPDLHEPLNAGQRREFRNQLGINEKHMVLYVGQFIHRKGIDVLFKAVRGLENTAVVLAGGENIADFIDGGISSDGLDSEKSGWNSSVDTHRENLSLKEYGHCRAVGFKSFSELIPYYQAADVFVLPTREDIWGLVVNEAMAMGAPVLTTTKCVAGCELIRDGENGFLIEADNDRELREKIGILLGDEDMRMNLAKQGYEDVRRYTIENMARVHVKIFEKYGQGRKTDRKNGK